LNAEYESDFQIAPSRHHFKKFVIEIAKKNYCHVLRHIIVYNLTM